MNSNNSNFKQNSEVQEEPVLTSDTQEEKIESQKETLEVEVTEPEITLSPIQEFSKFHGNFNERQTQIIETELDKYIDSDEFNSEEFIEFLKELSYKLFEDNNSNTNDVEIIQKRIEAITQAKDIESRRLERNRLDYENNTKYAPEKLIKNGINPLFQNLENAVKQLNKFPEKDQYTKFQEFIDVVVNFEANLTKSLEKDGNITMYGAVGDEFDPNLHYALGSVPFGVIPDLQHNHIGHVAAKGYKLHDRIVVPANVMVVLDPNEQ